MLEFGKLEFRRSVIASSLLINGKDGKLEDFLTVHSEESQGRISTLKGLFLHGEMVAQLVLSAEVMKETETQRNLYFFFLQPSHFCAAYIKNRINYCIYSEIKKLFMIHGKISSSMSTLSWLFRAEFLILASVNVTLLYFYLVKNIYHTVLYYGVSIYPFDSGLLEEWC